MFLTNLVIRELPWKKEGVLGSGPHSSDYSYLLNETVIRKKYLSSPRSMVRVPTSQDCVNH